MKEVMDCKCTLSQSLVGDGCDICNPTLALEYAREEIESLRQELAAALAACEKMRFQRYELIGVMTDFKATGVFDTGCQNTVNRAIAAIAINHDASALKAHDEALIEKCASFVETQRNNVPTCGFEFAAAIRELKSQL